MDLLRGIFLCGVVIFGVVTLCGGRSMSCGICKARGRCKGKAYENYCGCSQCYKQLGEPCSDIAKCQPYGLECINDGYGFQWRNPSLPGKCVKIPLPFPQPPKKTKVLRRPKKLPGVCKLDAETGMCRGYFERWYFDRKTKGCKKFGFGGCGGNKNNFDSLEMCNAFCTIMVPAQINPAQKKLKKKMVSNQQCKLQPESGMCRGYMKRWYYDTVLKACTTFVFGGCGGNKNNFASKSKCNAVCSRKVSRRPPRRKSRTQTKNSYCKSKPDTGPCFANFRRWYYDSKRKICKKFYFGGCKGNKNNFKYKSKCYKSCKKDVKIVTGEKFVVP